MKEEKTVFYPYSSWLKQRYGEKVYKLPVNLPVFLFHRYPARTVVTDMEDVHFVLKREPGLNLSGSLHR